VDSELNGRPAITALAYLEAGPPRPLRVDAVEKVGPSIGINALGIFDPAETGRRFGFTAA
jgi:hypothetical protein